MFWWFWRLMMFLSHLQRLQGGIKSSRFPLRLSPEGHHRLQRQHLQVPSGQDSLICSSIHTKPLRKMVGQESATVGIQHMCLHIITFTLCVNHTILHLSQYLAGTWKAKDVDINRMELTVVRTERHNGEPALPGPSITTSVPTSVRKVVGFWTPQGYEKPNCDPLKHCLPDWPLHTFKKENLPHTKTHHKAKSSLTHTASSFTKRTSSIYFLNSETFN